MSRRVDLNRLRETILENQRLNETLPVRQENKVFVNPEGRIIEGTYTNVNDSQLSEVPQEVFADRHFDEQVTVSSYMPANTKSVTTDEGVSGWLYCIDCELGTTYKMFAYFDGTYYQVIVIEPELETKWHDPHTGHLWSNGRICFGDRYNSGMPTLRDAFSKSCIWANGMSVAVVTEQFPFSINNY